MCGIAGFFISNNTEYTQFANKMQAAIRYRGRDGESNFTEHGVFHFCHSRLAVLDLETGNQPMHDSSGRYVIIHNGEIYNYIELRKEYENKGAIFHTKSDTEVILEGFRLKGAAICNDLNGMFAFAIWDKKERRLFLARDRMGKKPLFWTILRGSLYFSSTIDAFTSILGWTGKISPEILELQPMFGTFGLAHTVYEQVKSLPPASYAWATPQNQQPQINRYWAPKFNPKQKITEQEALEHYEELLTDAIRIRLRADVPIALTFSGGVDSGTIAALATKKLNRNIACFCIDYHTQLDPSEETEIATRTAKHLGLKLTPIFFDYHKELLPLLKEAYKYFDQPTTQLAIAYSLKLYQAIKPTATVILSGAGGDELFAGYNGNEVQLSADLAAPLQQIPAWMRYLLPTKLKNKFKIIANFPAMAANMYQTHSPLRQAIAENFYDIMTACKLNSNMDLLMFNGLYTSSADGNYRLADINGLQAQVEVRSPFLDYRLVEFAATLPANLKIKNADNALGNKWLPKKLYEKYVPKDIAWASKKGMGWNIRFDHSFVNDINYATEFYNTMKCYELYGFNTSDYYQAFEQYQIEKRKDMSSAPHCGNIMVTAFMQGQWLQRNCMAKNK